MENIDKLFLEKIKLENELNKNLKIDLRNFEKTFLSQLTDLEKIVFVEKYYNNKSLKLIAHENDISYAHARNISVNINRILKVSLNFIKEANDNG